MKRSPFSALPRLLAALSLFALAACASYAQSQSHEDLEKSIRAFNLRFEGKMMDISSPFVILDKQEEFLKKSLRVENDVTFYKTSILNVRLFDNDTPVRITSDGPDKEFNRADVLIRYQYTVRPSTQLRTQMVTQKWVHKEEDGWRVDPDIDFFFQPTESR